MNYLSKMDGTQIVPEERNYSEQTVNVTGAEAGMCDDPSFDLRSFTRTHLFTSFLRQRDIPESSHAFIFLQVRYHESTVH